MNTAATVYLEAVYVVMLSTYEERVSKVASCLLYRDESSTNPIAGDNMSTMV